MIYLVSKQQSLFSSTEYEQISIEQSINIINQWDVVQFDTETSGRNPHICKLLTAQFGNKKENIQIVVDCTTIDFLSYKNILETKLIVGHNLKFDCQFCYKYEIIPRHVWDTMIIEQLLHLGYDPKHIRYSLQAVAERRLGIHIDKTVRGEIIWRGIDERVVKYAAGDVIYLEDIMEQQIHECDKNQCINGAKLENSFVPVIAYLEWSGIYLNVDKWQDKMKHDLVCKREAEEALNNWLINYFTEHPWEKQVLKKSITVNQYDSKELSKWKKLLKNNKIKSIKSIDNYDGTVTYMYEQISENPYIIKDTQGDLFSGFSDQYKVVINWSSSEQLIPLFQLLGFNTKTEDKKTGESKDSVVEKLITKQKGINDEFLKLYFDQYSGACKVCSTYGQQYIDAINPITGRIHTVFKQLGATSGRMSCGNSKDSDTDLAKYKGIPASRCKYVQLQNLPADNVTRSCFSSQCNTLICSTDYSALELNTLPYIIFNL